MTDSEIEQPVWS